MVESAMVLANLSPLLGGACAGMLEITIFHPFDTINKRLMTNKAFLSRSSWRNILFEEPRVEAPISDSSSSSKSLKGVSIKGPNYIRVDVTSVSGQKSGMLRGFESVKFPLATSTEALSSLGSTSLWGRRMASVLLPGLLHAYLYKVLQRSFQFTTQHAITRYCFARFSPTTKRAKTLTQASAGALVGCGEAILLPMNTLKVRAQTNPAYRGLAAHRLLHRLYLEGGLSNLYAGWQWAVVRNAPGSFAMFGTNAAVKEYLFRLDDHVAEATFAQNVVSSGCGAVASIIVSSPFDVIKTRIQSGHSSGRSLSGMDIARQAWRDEGVRGFFKGSFTKCATAGTKLTVSFGVAQSAIGRIEEMLQGRQSA
mmetsp:Transcript_4301/g.10192  ORF Transcript_4301/g.10192 Transcript_4301/m.10192 type:complete len:367 (+) Transcript_4301:64-1164(+)